MSEEYEFGIRSIFLPLMGQDHSVCNSAQHEDVLQNKWRAPQWETAPVPCLVHTLLSREVWTRWTNALHLSNTSAQSSLLPALYRPWGEQGISPRWWGELQLEQAAECRVQAPRILHSVRGCRILPRMESALRWPHNQKLGGRSVVGCIWIYSIEVESEQTK